MRTIASCRMKSVISNQSGLLILVTGHCSLIYGAAHARAVEREGRDFDIEALALRRDHAVRAGHETRRGRERHPARVLERLSRLEHRLFADDAGPAHFLRSPHGIGDAPVTRLKLYRLRPAVDDLDGIGPEILALVR